MRRYITVGKWTPDNSCPLVLKPWDKVTLVKDDTKVSDYPGWTWCGKDSTLGWVPNKILVFHPETNSAEVSEDYNSKELCVRVGEPVIEIQETNEWFWCIQERTGEVGWLPKKILFEYDKVSDDANFLMSKSVSRETESSFHLRYLQPTDAERIFAILSNSEVKRYLAELPNPYELSNAEQFIKITEEWFLNKTAYHYAIAENENDSLIGVIGIRHDEKKRNIGHVGFWLEKSNWNKGITRKALEQIIDTVYSKYGINTIRAEVFDSNYSSKRILTGTGFELIGISGKPLSNGIITEPVFLYEKKLEL